jgi:DNA polymerase epsilon subunit 1
VPRVPHPAWLDSKVSQLNDRLQQKSITSMFKPVPPKQLTAGPVDIEDIGGQKKGSKRPVVHSRRRLGASKPSVKDKDDAANDEAKAARVELSKESFGDWLKQKKALWRRKRKEHRVLRPSNDASGGSTEAGSKRRKTVTSMEGFVREAAHALTHSEWQVVEIHEMSHQDGRGSPGSSGEMVMWVVVGKDSLQKIHVTVPRIVYISARYEIKNVSTEIMGFKKVDKNLPHGRSTTFVYEVTMPEYVYRNKQWIQGLQPVDEKLEQGDCLESVYETGTPLLSRALNELGCVSRVNKEFAKGQLKTSYSLTELSRVDRPLQGEYLHNTLSYKRLFLYTRLNPKSKTGLVALFVMEGGSGDFRKSSGEEGSSIDITRPSQSSPLSFDVSSACHLWVVKPGSSKGQRNVSTRHCETLFSALLEKIQDSYDPENDYACISPNSSCHFTSLKFVDKENDAIEGANEVIRSYSKGSNGPTIICLNSSKPVVQLRRYMNIFSSFPVVPLPFPPGPAHSPSMSTLPALNWEQPAIHLCLEAYLYMNVISWPNRVSYARYGQLPVGNMGEDENLALYDVGLSRLIQKNRTLSWCSPIPGQSDSGIDFVPSSDGVAFPGIETSGQLSNQDEIWCDDDELVSPVIRRQGEYKVLTFFS